MTTVSPQRFLRVRLLSLVFLAAILMPRPAIAQSARYAVVIEGTSGEEQYATMHRQWVDKLVGILRDKFKFEAANLTVLTETPKQGEALANIANVKATFGKLAQEAKK